MLHLGFTTIIDLLSWIVVVALGAKIVATLIVLLVDRDARDRPGWGSFLWWVTKVTPIVAVPCMVWIAVLQHDRDLLDLFLALAAFVVVAVPLAIRQRRRRMVQGRLGKAGCRNQPNA